MNSSDTIAAIATPPGQGGVGIVRISGPASRDIAREVTGLDLTPRQVHYCKFRNTEEKITIDKGLAILFLTPHSYTGEDVLELQGHGGPVVLDILLRRVLELGCRIARPGEFTERAFLNDKMDLAQAEAVSDLIESGSESAAKAAILSLNGVFSQQINELLQQLIEVRIYVESALDFAEEEIDFLNSEELSERLKQIKVSLNGIESQAKQGRLLKEGMQVVIAGEPNVGKSSLLNALTGSDSAIVTDIPGTTRDVLREQIHIDGMPLHIIDTAGLRESADPVEQEGIRRAHNQIRQADRVLVLSVAGDKRAEKPEWLDADIPVDFIFNKIDLTNHTPEVVSTESSSTIYLSAKTGNGMELLKKHLKKSMGFESTLEGTFIARRRHLHALSRTREHVNLAVLHLQKGRAGELCAEELRYAQDALNEITGEFTSDDLLGEIFSRFCIGK